MYKAYKYRLFPTAEQKILLEKHFGCVRKIYNIALEYRQEEYKNTGKSVSYSEMSGKLPEWKKLFPYLTEVNSQALQYAVKCVDTAFRNFFAKRARFPKFKNKKSKNSFTVPQGTKLNQMSNTISIPKFLPGIPTKIHRTFLGEVKSSTISRDPSGKYYISVLVKSDKNTLEDAPIVSKETVGLDLGLREFLVTSSGLRIENPKFLKTSLPRLKRLSRNLSKTKQHSKNRDKRRRRLSLLYERVTNQRKDFLHKVSHKIANDNQVGRVVVEDLSIKNMSGNRRLSRAIADVAWATFVLFLQYKLLDRGKQIIFADRFYPSSKTCHYCKHIHKELKLADRAWVCPSCGKLLDRDYNAALNLKDIGNTDGTAVIKACGEAVRLPRKHDSSKQEAHC